jgi:ubiquinone/menaquinone biosynthesis C-methylase UbiE
MKYEKDKVWKREDLDKRYLESQRIAIPLAGYQIEVMLYLVRKSLPRLKRFLDLGCGDGILGRAVLSNYPKAKGIFLDFSDTMIEAARKKSPKNNKNLVFITEDYGKPGWVKSVAKYGRQDLIISGFSIHHQKDHRKKSIYREIFDLLKPGGLFLNLEHVASATPWLKHVFDEFCIDALYEYHLSLDRNTKRKTIAKEHYNNPCRKANILSPVEKQCLWLREMGFKEVDCYLKIFELAIFGGIKPG